MKKVSFILEVFYQALGYLWHLVVYIGLIPLIMYIFSQGLDYFLFEVLINLSFSLPATFVPIYNLFAVFVFAGGVLIFVEAVIGLYEEAKTFPFTVVPHRQLGPGKLAQSGWYGRVRHPMLLGYLVCLMGVGLVLRSPSFFLWWVPLIGGVMLFFTINSEEKKLLRWFGDEYLRYQQNIPALIPKLFKR